MIDIGNYHLWKRLRSTPWRLVLISFAPVYIPLLAVWFSFNTVSVTVCLIILPVMLLLWYLFPPKIREYRRKSVENIMSFHNCPHCGYSLVNIPEQDDSLTQCPECGVAWRLPDRRKEIPKLNYRRDIIILGSFALFESIIIIVLTQSGDPVFSIANLLIVFFFAFLLFQTVTQWVRFNRNKPHMVVPRHQGLQTGVCPACDAWIGENLMNQDGLTRCPECLALWKIPVDNDVS